MLTEFTFRTRLVSLPNLHDQPIWEKRDSHRLGEAFVGGKGDCHLFLGMGTQFSGASESPSSRATVRSSLSMGNGLWM